jgi:roadblock/LC7 domain-containing protein
MQRQNKFQYHEYNDMSINQPVYSESYAWHPFCINQNNKLSMNLRGVAMIGLDRLMAIPGVIAVGQCDSEGNIIRKEGHIPLEARDKISKMNAEQTKKFNATAQIMGQLTDLEWTPMMGWMMWGGRYALCVVQNNCLIIEAKHADFNQLMVDLLGSGPTGPRIMPS